MSKDNYDFGFTNYRGIHGEPVVEWELIRPDPLYKVKMAVAYIGLAISGSMVVAPMAWVELFKWIFSK
jgi:hypothetical protein